MVRSTGCSLPTPSQAPKSSRFGCIESNDVSTQSSVRTGRVPGRNLIGHFSNCPQAPWTSRPRLLRTVTKQPLALSRSRKAWSRASGGSRKGAAGCSFMRMRLMLWPRARSPSQSASRSRVRGGVVLPGHEHVLHQQLLAGRQGPPVQGLPQPGQVPGAVHRHDPADRASSVVALRLRASQGRGRMPRQALDGRRQAGGGDGDAPGGDVQARPGG